MKTKYWNGSPVRRIIEVKESLDMYLWKWQIEKNNKQKLTESIEDDQLLQCA